MKHTVLLGYGLVALVAPLWIGCSDDSTETVGSSGDAGPEGSPREDAEPEETDAMTAETALPIVFVHGGAGSAQQYASQAMRFAANGYPQDRIVAYDHDGEGFDVERFIPGLDEFVDETLERFDAEKVYLVGHSRGTLVSTTYLSDEEHLAKVAKYISLDGAPCAEDLAIPCINPNQAMLPGQKHVEVATSKESFEMQYDFLVGHPPDVVDIVKQSAPVELVGRAVNFPANTGRDGTELAFYEVDPETGGRLEEEPIATFDIGEDGDWGPVTVSPEKHYELVLFSPDSDLRQHFYPQPYLRTSYLERLLSGPPDSQTRMNSNLGEGHTALTVLRMREWLPSDVLNVSMESESGNLDRINVITDDNVPRPEAGDSLGVGEPIAIYLHDDVATPQETTLELLPWFPEQFFQTGIDLYLPAADPPDGTITLTNFPRGNEDEAQTLNVPNWPSDTHTVMVLFSDFPQQ